MTKTNGSREIDLDIEECPECKMFHKMFEYNGEKLARGKIVIIDNQSYNYRMSTTFFSERSIEDCKNCNATGYIRVNCDKLELE